MNRVQQGTNGDLATVDRLGLRFANSELEKSFLTHYRSEMLGIIRSALLIGLALYAVFGLLDIVIIPDHVRPVWFIRYGVVVPVVTLTLAISFIKTWGRYLEASVMLSVALSGLGIVAMVLIAEPPGSDLYYAGLILVMMFGYTFVRLRFWQALLVCWSVTGAYLFSVTILDPAPPAIQINNAFFLVSANVIGMAACYQMERHTRKEYALTLELEQGAAIDPLTGAYNRRHLDSEIARLLALTRRYATPFSLILLDMDDFKSVNDRYGHTAGDELLRVVATSLKDSVRETDIVVRFGGDEFVILAPSTPVEGAEVLGRRLVTRLRQVKLTGVDSPVEVSLSAGVSTVTGEASNAHDLLKVASVCLRRAKARGKRQVDSPLPEASEKKAVKPA